MEKERELRILILEDSPIDAELMAHVLRNGGLTFVAKRVDSREAFVHALEELKPDVVLLDYHLPEFDGQAALKIVRRDYPEIPAIMVSGAVGDEKAIELLKLGAKDYVLKDRMTRLAPTIRRALAEEQGIRSRKAAEKALLQSEAELRTLVEYSPIAMIVDEGVDAAEKVLMMNQQFTELFGYTMEDIPDFRHWWPLAYPDEKYREEVRTEWIKRVEKAIQSRHKIEPMEVTVTCKDGSHRYIKASLASIGSRNIITFENLTERKLTEEKLRESEARFRVVADSALALVWMAGPDKLCTWFNKIWLDFTGRTMEQEIGNGWVEGVHPDDLQRCMDIYVSHFDRRETFRMEYRLKRHDGEYRWIYDSGTPRFDEKGNFLGYIGSCFDITERNAHETKIKRLNELLLTLRKINEYLLVIESEQKLFQTVCDALNKLGDIAIVWIVPKESGLKTLPVAWAGIAETELTALKARCDDAEQGIGFIRNAIKERKPVVIPDIGVATQLAAWQEVLRKWGIKSATAIPVQLGDEVIATLSVFSHQHDAFDEGLLKFLHEVSGDVSLGIQNFRMTKELGRAHGLLLQSEKMASIGQLAAGVAHEINNPVGYVNSNLGTLEKYLADIFALINKYEQAEAQMDCHGSELDELRQFKKRIDLDYLKQDTSALLAESRQGLERVKKIVLDLKDFSRTSSSEEWEWADIHQCLESTLSVVWNELKYKCEVKKEYGVLPQVYCLPSQLNQVFMNLLVNAAQAIKVRGKITIRTGHEGGQVWVEIADTGSGIQTEHLPQLFDPFFTTKPVGKGTGLGLSVSYSIVQKHGGKIEVHSEVNKGTVMRIWLPVNHAHHEP